MPDCTKNDNKEASSSIEILPVGTFDCAWCIKKIEDKTGFHFFFPPNMDSDKDAL